MQSRMLTHPKTSQLLTILSAVGPLAAMPQPGFATYCPVSASSTAQLYSCRSSALGPSTVRRRVGLSDGRDSSITEMLALREAGVRN